MRYTLYEASRDDKCRFVLGVPGDRTLLVVGVNPHLANQFESDRTASLVEKVASDHGYDGFLLLNLYPARSRCVSGLPVSANSRAIRSNRSCIERHLCIGGRKDVWLAWGNDIKKRAYLADEAVHLIALAKAAKAKLLHFGPLTKYGQPRHPSRLCHAWAFSYFKPAAAQEISA